MPVLNPLIYLVAAVCFLYLFLMYVLQKSKSRIHEKTIIEAKNAYEIAQAQLKESRNKLFDTISSIYGYEYGYMVRNGEMWIGMPTHLILVAKGKANNIKQTADTNALIQTWIYHNVDQFGKTQTSLEINIKNGLVLKWDEKY